MVEIINKMGMKHLGIIFNLFLFENLLYCIRKCNFFIIFTMDVYFKYMI